MGGTGWSNPFPLEMGGGPTEIERAYQMLRAAEGKGAASTDDESIEALWRQSLAKGVGLVGTFGERAALQAFPNKATDLLPYYERLLHTEPSPDASEEERRQTAATRFTAGAAFLHSEIETALQEIDARFEVEIIDEDLTTTTIWGRWFEDLAAAEPFGGGRRSTIFPNYASEFVFIVVLDLAGALPTPTEARAILRAQRHLAETLPAWESIGVVTSFGFELDVDRLDYTALSP